MRRLDFIVAGVQKAGTTTLFEYMRQHPLLSVPARKELHFFDDETIDWSAPDYSRLEAWFPPSDAGQLRFDVTPIYTFWPPSLARIQAHNPDAKLIVLFRDPIERAWSHWCMEFSLNTDALPFDVAIRSGRQRLAADPLHPSWRVYSYVERGFYSAQVRRLSGLFPPENCLFLRFDELVADHAGVLQTVARFLGVPEFPPSAPIKANARPERSYPTALGQDDVDYLADVLGADLEQFAQLTGLAIDTWPTTTRRILV